jgi:hypothetical protein
MLGRRLCALQKYFGRYDLKIDVEPFVSRVVKSLDRFGLLTWAPMLVWMPPTVT